MKRYILFAGDKYYPAGGWDDFQGTFDTKEEIRELQITPAFNPDWWHVVDTQTMEIVDSNFH